MTTTQTTDFGAAIDAHLAAMTPVHKAAFRLPAVHEYAVGTAVWMLDHYNTATVTGPGRIDGTWAVITTDADGSVSRFEYRATQLRPALAVCEFRWL